MPHLRTIEEKDNLFFRNRIIYEDPRNRGCSDKTEKNEVTQAI